MISNKALQAESKNESKNSRANILYGRCTKYEKWSQCQLAHSLRDQSLTICLCGLEGIWLSHEIYSNKLGGLQLSSAFKKLHYKKLRPDFVQ